MEAATLGTWNGSLLSSPRRKRTRGGKSAAQVHTSPESILEHLQGVNLKPQREMPASVSQILLTKFPMTKPAEEVTIERKIQKTRPHFVSTLTPPSQVPSVSINLVDAPMSVEESRNLEALVEDITKPLSEQELTSEETKNSANSLRLGSRPKKRLIIRAQNLTGRYYRSLIESKEVELAQLMKPVSLPSDEELLDAEEDVEAMIAWNKHLQKAFQSVAPQAPPPIKFPQVKCILQQGDMPQACNLVYCKQKNEVFCNVQADLDFVPKELEEPELLDSACSMNLAKDASEMVVPQTRAKRKTPFEEVFPSTHFKVCGEVLRDETGAAPGDELEMPLLSVPEDPYCCISEISQECLIETRSSVLVLTHLAARLHMPMESPPSKNMSYQTQEEDFQAAPRIFELPQLCPIDPNPNLATIEFALPCISLTAAVFESMREQCAPSKLKPRTGLTKIQLKAIKTQIFQREHSYRDPNTPELTHLPIDGLSEPLRMNFTQLGDVIQKLGVARQEGFTLFPPCYVSAGFERMRKNAFILLEEWGGLLQKKTQQAPDHVVPQGQDFSIEQHLGELHYESLNAEQFNDDDLCLIYRERLRKLPKLEEFERKFLPKPRFSSNPTSSGTARVAQSLDEFMKAVGAEPVNEKTLHIPIKEIGLDEDMIDLCDLIDSVAGPILRDLKMDASADNSLILSSIPLGRIKAMLRQEIAKIRQIDMALERKAISQEPLLQTLQNLLLLQVLSQQHALLISCGISISVQFLENFVNTPEFSVVNSHSVSRHLPAFQYVLSSSRSLVSAVKQQKAVDHMKIRELIKLAQEIRQGLGTPTAAIPATSSHSFATNPFSTIPKEAPRDLLVVFVNHPFLLAVVHAGLNPFCKPIVLEDPCPGDDALNLICDTADCLVTTHEVLWQHTTFPWQKVHTVVFYEEAPTSAPPAYLSSLLESKVIAAWTLVSAVQHTSKARPTYPTSSFPSRARVIANERFGSEFVETSQYLRESTSFILRDLGFESIILDERHCVVMKSVSTLLRVPDAQAEVKDWVNQLALLSAKFTKCYFILYFEEVQYDPKYFSPLLRLFGSVTTKFLLEMVVYHTFGPWDAACLLLHLISQTAQSNLVWQGVARWFSRDWMVQELSHEEKFLAAYPCTNTDRFQWINMLTE